MGPCHLECEECGSEVQWLRTKEIAGRMGVSQQAVRRWIGKGLVHSRKLPNGRWLVCWKSVIETGGVRKRVEIKQPAIPLKIKDKRINQAVAYIHASLDRKLTVKELANQAAMSLKHFEVVFKKETGLRPRRYLRMARVEEAKQLLTDPNLSITEVALEIGYSDLTHFERDFKRVTGVRPKEYRKSCR